MMQKLIFTFAVVATLSMSSLVMAQRPGGGGRGGDGPPRGGQRGGGAGQRPVSPLMTALDTDKDGKLSAEEISNAAKALKALDKNEDGALDTSELAPQRGGARGGRGGGGGRGGDASDRINRMMELDADKDGKISKEEGGDRMSRFFEFMDGDKDGFLSKTEIEESMKRFQGGGGGGGRGGNSYRQPPAKSKDNRPAFDDN